MSDTTAALPRLDGRKLRTCLGSFATGVTVITYLANGEPRGATVSSFTSVSLDPPLILVSVARTAKTASLLPGQPFVVNVLAANQRDVALHFAGRPRDDLDVPWSQDARTPRLRGTLAWLECVPWATYDGGDHLMFVGEVVHHDHRPGEPLLFHRGTFHTLGLAFDYLPPTTRRGEPRAAQWLSYAHQLHHLSEPGLISV
ncbi:flavin reductase family protein [Haloechinothrix salitolerans]|uniref:Flavin reductase family protein n=1 Tax=Haloechinothrix salitolerans TaxID=926830 RepID=A0ABW2C6Q6_9PSEU